MSISEYYKVRCKCVKCGATQLVKIQEIASGNPKCWRGSLSRNPCEGELNFYTEDSQDSISNALNVLGYLNVTVLAGRSDSLAELVDTVVDDADHWLEGEQTPQQMAAVELARKEGRL